MKLSKLVVILVIGILFTMLFTACGQAETTRADLLYPETGYIWDEKTATLTFTESGEIGDFFYKVPEDVKNILIKEGVTITGGFKFYHDATIEGESWDTSIIYGTDEQRYTQNNNLNPWEYNAIGVHADATVNVRKLQVLNPRGYCISGYEPASIIHVEHVKMIDDRGGDQNNSDGFIGANGSTLKDVYFDLGDDTIKLYRDMAIEDVEIHMQHNGAPIQIGWNDDNNGGVTATIKNLKITGDQEEGYNLAVISWVNENHTKTVDLTIDGLYIEVPEAALFKLAPPNATANFTFDNANILTAIYGSVTPSGTISINGLTDETNYYSYNGLIPKPEVAEREPSPYQTVALAGTPVIDGEIEALWDDVPAITTDKVRLGEKETTATYQLMWDEDNFYVLVKVIEPSSLNNENEKIWHKDSIEVFLDDNNEKTPAYQMDDRHTIISFANDIERFDVVGVEGVESMVVLTDDGYMVEAKFPFFTPHVAGDILGFDGQVNSTDGGAARASITGWSGAQDLSDKKPSVWGEVALQER